eukprot:4041130-Alexandrium_andersonii.AAC.1
MRRVPSLGTLDDPWSEAYVPQVMDCVIPTYGHFARAPRLFAFGVLAPNAARAVYTMVEGEAPIAAVAAQAAELL